MAGDLSFWKVKEKINIPNSEIYSALSSGEYLFYIDEIPKNEILKDFNIAFSDWENHKNNYEKGFEAFQLMVTNQFVRADCSEMTAGNINKIIDILGKYGIPLYDSCIDVRFEN